MRLSPDGTHLFASSTGRFELVDLTRKSVQATIPRGEHVKEILDVTFQEHVPIWLARGWKNGEYWLSAWTEAKPNSSESLLLPRVNGWPSFAFSPDGHFLASIDYLGFASVWRLELQPLRLNPVVMLEGFPTGHSASLAFSPDNQLLAVGVRDSIYVVGPKENRPFHQVRHIHKGTQAGESLEAYHLTFSEGGDWVGAILGSSQGAFHLWKLPDDQNQPVQDFGSWGRFYSHLTVRDISIWPDGGALIVVNNGLGKEKVFSLPAPNKPPISEAVEESSFQERWSPLHPRVYGEGLGQSQLSPEGSEVITVNASGVSQWNRFSEEETLRIEEPAHIMAFDARPKLGTWVTGTEEGQVRVWRVGAARYQVFSLEVSAERVERIASSPDGGVLAAIGTGDSTALLAIWKSTGLEHVAGPGDFGGFEHQEDLEWDWDSALASNDTGSVLAGGPNGLYRIQTVLPPGGDVTHKQKIAPWPVHAMTEDGAFAVSCEQGGCVIRDLRKDEQVLLPSPPKSEFIFSTDGSTLATVAGHEVRFWRRRLPDGSWAPSPTHIFGKDMDINKALSPTGARFAVAKGSRIDVWDTAKGLSTRSFRSDSPISALTFSRDEQFLAAADEVGTIHLWDLGSGTRAMQFDSPAEVWALHFTRDGRYLAAGTNAGEVRLYPWKLEDVCARVTYNFSDEEWQQFFPEEDYHETCPGLPRWPSPSQP